MCKYSPKLDLFFIYKKQKDRRHQYVGPSVPLFPSLPMWEKAHNKIIY